MITQTQMVLQHLQQKGSITPMEALNLYGCYRLSDVIFRLRGNSMRCGKYKYSIRTIDMDYEDRYGNKKTYAKYVLEKEE